MRIRFHGISPLAGCLFGLLIGALLTALLLLPRLTDLHAQHAKHYGTALATMAAHQAIDATFNHDLVRLQVILTDVMENPGTELATIHDVENNLLVQAGDTRALTDDAGTFTAPIVLHDSIAGYLSVTLTEGQALPTAYRWLLMSITALLLILLSVDLYRNQSFELEHSETVEDPVEPEDEPAEPLPAPEDLPKVYSIIHIKNMAVLQQQLNGEAFRRTLAVVEQTISDVLALYTGAGYQIEDDQIRLTFYANDATNEALFRAACSAWLVVELASIINNIPLDLAAFVSANHLDLAPANLPIAGIVLESRAASDELIQRRLQFVDVGSDDGRKVVAGFEQPFQSLLERQRSQLTQL